MSFNLYDTDTEDFREIFTAQEASKKIYDTIQFYATRAEELSKANQELRNKAEEMVRHQYEDEIAQLKRQLSFSYGEFASTKEKDAFINFTKRHMHNRMNSKYEGGLAPYLIPVYTGLGTSLTAVCQICGEKENITDMEVW